MSIKSDKLWFAVKEDKEIESAAEFVFASSAVPGLSKIEQRLPELRDEYFRVAENGDLFTPYFEAMLSEPPGSWDTIPILVFGLWRRPATYFPILARILQDIPDVVGCFLSRLEPKSNIAPHSGITNGIFRCQAAFVLPSADDSVTGFEVAGTRTPLSLDKFVVFVDANVHKAWNHAESERVILIVDFMRPQFQRMRSFMCARIACAYLILKFTVWTNNRILSRFIGTRASRRLINLLAVPLIPVYMLLAKVSRWRFARV